MADEIGKGGGGGTLHCAVRRSVEALRCYNGAIIHVMETGDKMSVTENQCNSLHSNAQTRFDSGLPGNEISCA